MKRNSLLRFEARKQLRETLANENTEQVDNVTAFFERFESVMIIAFSGVALFALSVILATFICVVLYSFYHIFWR